MFRSLSHKNRDEHGMKCVPPQQVRRDTASVVCRHHIPVSATTHAPLIVRSRASLSSQLRMSATMADIDSITERAIEKLKAALPARPSNHPAVRPALRMDCEVDGRRRRMSRGAQWCNWCGLRVSSVTHANLEPSAALRDIAVPPR